MTTTACPFRSRIAAVAAVLAVWCALGSPSAVSDVDECDWTIASDAGNKQDKTQEEIEAELVRQLTIKVRQFDRCLDQELASASTAAAADAASQAAGGGQAAGADGAGGQQRDGADGDRNGDAGDGRGRPGEAAPGSLGDPIADAGRASLPDSDSGDADALPGRADPVAMPPSAEQPDPGNPALPGGGRAPVPDHAAEDDIARILREAAEKETDPTRRAALWKEYENYVKTL